MNYVAIVTNTLGRKYFFEVRIFSEEDGYVGDASLIFGEEGGYSHDMEVKYYDVHVKKKYREEVSQEKIEEKCRKIMEINKAC